MSREEIIEINNSRWSLIISFPFNHYLLFKELLSIQQNSSYYNDSQILFRIRDYVALIPFFYSLELILPHTCFVTYCSVTYSKVLDEVTLKSRNLVFFIYNASSISLFLIVNYLQSRLFCKYKHFSTRKKSVFLSIYM